MGEVSFRDGPVALATVWPKAKATGEVDLLQNRLLLRVVLLVLKGTVHRGFQGWACSEDRGAKPGYDKCCSWADGTYNRCPDDVSDKHCGAVN